MGGIPYPLNPVDAPLPRLPAGFEPAGPATPLSGLAAHGVPVGYGPHGSPVLLAGQSQGLQLPPNLPGMPRMPGPPRGMFSGGLDRGGLFGTARPWA